MSHEKLSLSGETYTHHVLGITIENFAVYAHNTCIKTNQGKTLQKWFLISFPFSEIKGDGYEVMHYNAWALMAWRMLTCVTQKVSLGCQQGYWLEVYKESLPCKQTLKHPLQFSLGPGACWWSRKNPVSNSEMAQTKDSKAPESSHSTLSFPENRNRDWEPGVTVSWALKRDVDISAWEDENQVGPKKRLWYPFMTRDGR